MTIYHLDACVNIEADDPEEALTKLYEQCRAAILNMNRPYSSGEVYGEIILICPREQVTKH